MGKVCCCWVDADLDAIRPGDLLTGSRTAGHAQGDRPGPRVRGHRGQGARGTHGRFERCLDLFRVTSKGGVAKVWLLGQRLLGCPPASDRFEAWLTRAARFVLRYLQKQPDAAMAARPAPVRSASLVACATRDHRDDLRGRRGSASTTPPLLTFVLRNYKNFNARATRDALLAYWEHIERGGKMFWAVAGAMSSAQLGITLAPAIRAGLIHGLSVTGANLEESLFRLVAHDGYRDFPDYRYFTKQDDTQILDNRMRRVTDTSIPEDQAFRAVEKHIVPMWERATANGERRFWHESGSVDEQLAEAARIHGAAGP